jgi:hypothetical protein
MFFIDSDVPKDRDGDAPKANGGTVVRCEDGLWTEQPSPKSPARRTLERAYPEGCRRLRDPSTSQRNFLAHLKIQRPDRASNSPVCRRLDEFARESVGKLVVLQVITLVFR